MDISWIKLKTKRFDDEKIQLIEAMPEADAILVIWIKLLILAGKTNSNGYILLAENIPYSPEMLSTIFRRPLQIVKFALKTLKDFGMIEVTESNVMLISNWEKHQNIEGLDRVREQNRIRQSNFRTKKLQLSQENKESVTLQSRDITQQIKSKNKNIEREREGRDSPTIWKSIFPNKTPGMVEINFVEELRQKFGAIKASQILFNLRESNFSSIRTMKDALDEDGTIKPKQKPTDEAKTIKYRP